MTVENKFSSATAAIRSNLRGASYKRGITAVNLAAEFMRRGVNVQDGQFEK